jgi:hypothetical protein
LFAALAAQGVEGYRTGERSIPDKAPEPTKKELSLEKHVFPFVIQSK